MEPSINEIEVYNALEITKNEGQMEKEVTDITKMTPKEIEAYLEEQKSIQKKEKEKAYHKFTDERDSFINYTVDQFSKIHRELKTLKEVAITKANEYYDRMYALKDKKPKEVKSFQLVDKANKFKITIERAERFKFTEEATVHIHSIKDIFKSKFESRHKGFYSVLDGILMRNSKGEYDAKLLAKARQQIKKLGDTELIKEFEALEQCQIVESASTYVRAYAKNQNGKWEDINVQFSSL
ncbi:hypothetical protein [Aquimarina algiphila]|uniref:hypothetical protein n=1 Tax=Aquimarina algiphila TaxID=2047982 RepID=UPI0023302BEA|nr:hypothetical protein [Aquimarina algiphila]